MKRFQFGLMATQKLIPALAIVGLSTMPATATPTEVLLRTGQTLPGDGRKQPVAKMTDFGIDSQRNVTVITENQTYQEPYGYTFTFRGIYLFAPGQAAKLIGSASSESVQGRSTGSSFIGNPSISLGQVAYSYAFSARYVSGSLINFGVPGAVKNLTNAPPDGTVRANDSIATVNGKVFFLYDPGTVSGVVPQNNGIVKYENGQYQTVVQPNNSVITAGGKPALSVNDRSFVLRASSMTLVFSRFVDNAGAKTLQVFELPNGGSLRKIYEAAGNEFCGLSASRSNVVLCLDGKILARRGSSPAFAEIDTASEITFAKRQPSISNETVVFVANPLPSIKGAPGGQAIYLSRPGQPTRSLVKTVGEPLALSSTGQSINGSAVVYLYNSQESGKQELRRLILQ